MASSSEPKVMALGNITEGKNNNTEEQISNSFRHSHNQQDCSLGKHGK